jgi:hypothetical protein
MEVPPVTTFLKILAALAVTLPTIIQLIESILQITPGTTLAEMRAHSAKLKLPQ